MKYLLSTPSTLAKLEHISHGGTMGIINVDIMKELTLPIPPLTLQEEFLKIQKQVNRIINSNHAATELPLFNSLSQKAFAGEL
jgi:type I restriction enzyme S subunit